MIKTMIEIDVTDMQDGVITRFKFNDNVYSIEKYNIEDVKSNTMRKQGGRGTSETLVSK
jgi:hypothetical protein